MSKSVCMEGWGISVILCTCYCFLFCYSEKTPLTPLEMAQQCKGILMDTDAKPREKGSNDSLRVLVPWKTGYTEFVNFRPDTCIIDGFSVQVFLQAVRRMEQSSTPLRYQFVVHGTGNVTLPYNQMLDMLKNKSVDMVVADLTITAERMETVSFTVPYMPSSLAMVTPYSYGSAGAVLDFSKPFSRNLWIALSISFVVTGFVFYFLEDKNHDFSTTSKLHSGGKIRAYLTERLASGQLSSPQDGDEHQNTIPSGSLHDAPTGNPPPPGSSFEIHQDKPLLSRSPSHGTHIPSSFNTVHSVANENASAISPRRANFEVEKAHATKDNHIRSNDTQFQQQPVGVPIYDEASRFRRFTNAFWFTSMCFFQSQQESVRTHLGRIVVVMWLFLTIIFNSSYTASLASLLSAKQRNPTIESFEALSSDPSIPIGYQSGSFMDSYMNNLLIEGHEIHGLASIGAFNQAFRKGPESPGGIGAALDELPCVQVLVGSKCDLTIVSTTRDRLPTFGGFGFAFRKGDPLIEEISKSILKLEQDGTLQVLQNGWNIGTDRSNKCESNDTLRIFTLRSFVGLFGIMGVVYAICLMLRWVISTCC